MRSYEEWRKVLEGERLPALVVDLDAFDRNVKRVAELAGGKKLRVASKSIRIPSLIRRVLSAGAPYQGLMCFSAEEAELLAGEGFDDLLVAYPSFQDSDLSAMRRVHESGHTVSLVLDSPEGLRRVDEAMRGVRRAFPVIVEVDMSLRVLGQHIGVRRSPVRTSVEVMALVDEANRLDHVRFAGLMGYEAQVAGLGDRNPFKKAMNPAFRLVRRWSARSAAKRRGKIAWDLARQQVPIEVFNGGGSGSLNFTNRENSITELTAGSAFLCSHLFDYYTNVSFEPALYFALQAVREPAPGMVTCLGGGYVSSGEPGWDKCPVPALPEGARLVSMEGCGEVQTPVELRRGTEVPVGAPVLFRPSKAGEPAERFNEALLVQGDRVVERVKTYRGMGKCYF